MNIIKTIFSKDRYEIEMAMMYYPILKPYFKWRIKRFVKNQNKELLLYVINVYRLNEKDYQYSNSIMDSNMEYFCQCYYNGLSEYKTMELFYDNINGKY